MRNVLVALSALFIVSAQAQLDSTLENQLQNILDTKLSPYGLTGVEATIILPSGCTWTGVSGVGGAGTPIDTSLEWHWGSFGKAMTAAIVLQLHQSGSLDINDPIGQYLDADTIPFLDSTITIKRLLNHTSGLGNSWSTGSNLWNDVYSDRDSVWNIWDVLSYRSAGTPNPGLTHSYNPYDNYLILGFLIEAVTGNLLEAVYNNRLFVPLGFTNSSVGTYGVTMTNLNGVYNGSQNRSTWLYDSYMSTRGAGGNYMGHSRDAARFIRAFHSDQLVSPALMDEVRTPTLGTPATIPGSCLGDLEQTYGYGTNILYFIDAQDDTIKMYGHGGRGLSNALAFHSIDEDITIVVVNNDLTLAAQQSNYLLFTDLACHLWDNLNTIRCDSYVGLEEELLDDFKIYPNPGSDYIQIEGPTVPEKVMVFDYSGKQVFEVAYQNSIDLSKLGKGVYLIKLELGGHYTSKVWVKE